MAVEDDTKCHNRRQLRQPTDLKSTYHKLSIWKPPEFSSSDRYHRLCPRLGLQANTKGDKMRRLPNFFDHLGPTYVGQPNPKNRLEMSC